MFFGGPGSKKLPGWADPNAAETGESAGIAMLKFRQFLGLRQPAFPRCRSYFGCRSQVLKSTLKISQNLSKPGYVQPDQQLVRIRRIPSRPAKPGVEAGCDRRIAHPQGLRCPAPVDTKRRNTGHQRRAHGSGLAGQLRRRIQLDADHFYGAQGVRRNQRSPLHPHSARPGLQVSGSSNRSSQEQTSDRGDGHRRSFFFVF